VVACSSNSPGGTTDSLCDPAIANCSAPGGPTQILYWIYQGPAGVTNPTATQWEFTGSQCLGPGQAGTQAAPVPVVTADDFRRLPLPPGQVHVQPGTGRTLINVPTNVYVGAGTTIIPTTVLGVPVRVQATPSAYDWTFGDGQTMHTTDPGAPYPDLRTTHTYTTPGTVSLGLTTTYTGQYSVNGGPWQPINGTAAVTSPTQALTAVAAHAELVDQPLPS
jgi:hypothetical protein